MVYNWCSTSPFPHPPATSLSIPRPSPSLHPAPSPSLYPAPLPLFTLPTLPLYIAVASKATSLAGSFLWAGHLERLAWQELHNPRLAGGLGVSCVTSRGQALLAKQLCLQVAAGGIPAAHLAFWLGQAVGHYVPSLARGSHPSILPAPLVGGGGCAG